ncbi:MAG: hypothetical protein WC307_07110 [Candidatus Nanoarchaeia archaeon]|jgi:hypothetical protein
MTRSTFDWQAPSIYGNGQKIAIKWDKMAYVLNKASLIEMSIDMPNRAVMPVNTLVGNRLCFDPYTGLVTIKLTLACSEKDLTTIYNEKGVNIKFKEEVINLLDEAYKQVVKREKKTI